MARPIVIVVAMLIAFSMYYGFRTAQKQKALQQQREAQMAKESEEVVDEA
jgi:uncharacterized membrane protein YukC